MTRKSQRGRLEDLFPDGHLPSLGKSQHPMHRRFDAGRMVNGARKLFLAERLDEFHEIAVGFGR